MLVRDAPNASRTPVGLPIRLHGTAKQTNYISPTGDHTTAVEMPVETTKQSWYFLTGIDVAAPREVEALVALGDSLTDGNLSRVPSVAASMKSWCSTTG
jgi:hypothetical protein